MSTPLYIVSNERKKGLLVKRSALMFLVEFRSVFGADFGEHQFVKVESFAFNEGEYLAHILDNLEK